jgi:hypothetical protein
MYLQWRIVSPTPNPRVGGPPFSAVHGCLINVFAATLYNWKPSLHLQSEDAPCCGDRDPPNIVVLLIDWVFFIVSLRLKEQSLGISFCFRYQVKLWHLVYSVGARVNVVGWGTMLQIGRSRILFPMKPFFNLSNSSSRSMLQGLTKTLTEMSNSDLLKG